MATTGDGREFTLDFLLEVSADLADPRAHIRPPPQQSVPQASVNSASSRFTDSATPDSSSAFPSLQVHGPSEDGHSAHNDKAVQASDSPVQCGAPQLSGQAPDGMAIKGTDNWCHSLSTHIKGLKESSETAWVIIAGSRRIISFVQLSARFPATAAATRKSRKIFEDIRGKFRKVMSLNSNQRQTPEASGQTPATPSVDDPFGSATPTFFAHGAQQAALALRRPSFTLHRPQFHSSSSQPQALFVPASGFISHFRDGAFRITAAIGLPNPMPCDGQRRFTSTHAVR
ncbi:hypothetical protein BKA70DRAFT_1449071 [Coprinopsis sp. MPI-PUGE-AT-0042]|nr:hypothetical protein BKA70DRAFT_1449071 [Coprinopsis sp. MPI-PUGE-AT-0042]